MWAEKMCTIVSVWHPRSVSLVLSVCFCVSFVFSVCLCVRWVMGGRQETGLTPQTPQKKPRKRAKNKLWLSVFFPLSTGLPRQAMRMVHFFWRGRTEAELRVCGLKRSAPFSFFDCVSARIVSTPVHCLFPVRCLYTYPRSVRFVLSFCFLCRLCSPSVCVSVTTQRVSA